MMTTNASREDREEQRRLEAADWLLTFQKETISTSTLEAWKAWESVPENREMFDRVEQLWSILDQVAAPADPSAEELAADHYVAAQTISRWQLRRQPIAWAHWPAAIAASLVAAVLISLLMTGRWPFDGPDIHAAIIETKIAEHRVVTLSDGSTVELGGKTSMSAVLDAHQRTVALNRGEALFTVARDSQRPFKVTAGSATITAIGTAFNVRRRDDDHVVVTVTEGVVQVQADAAGSPLRRVESGEQITYDGVGAFSAPASADEVAAVAWRSGQLRYSSQPLRVVIEDVNRYSQRRVVLSDEAAGDLPYTGTFFERDVDEWIGHLERSYPELEVTPVKKDVHTIYVRTRATSRP